jgi:hypothetical protein
MNGYKDDGEVRVIMSNVILNNISVISVISVISWLSVLLVENPEKTTYLS